MSHYSPGGDGWSNLEWAKANRFELPVNLRPHVRGVVIEETSEFLFGILLY